MDISQHSSTDVPSTRSTVRHRVGKETVIYFTVLHHKNIVIINIILKIISPPLLRTYFFQITIIMKYIFLPKTSNQARYGLTSKQWNRDGYKFGREHFKSKSVIDLSIKSEANYNKNTVYF